jgi:tetrachlorobenzoquinone reductase
MEATSSGSTFMAKESDASNAASLQPGLELDDGLLTLRLRRVTWEGEGVVSLEFVDPAGADLPQFSPGAHVDLRLPHDIVRQYSLCGDPADRKSYRIAVREIEGGRASRLIHRELRPGELLRVGAPRNNFPFLPAPRYVFVAGGIGVTPLLPMMREATRAGAAWTLFYCAKRPQAAFLEEIRTLPGEIRIYASEAGARLDVNCLADRAADSLLYCCGPERLMRAVEEACAAWPEDAVRFEWFQPRVADAEFDDGAFEVVCQLSGRTIDVPRDKSVLRALAEAGIETPSSCEQGVCGTCETRVLEGEVDHRDSILSSSERAANASMMTCVSRARGRRLVLEI